MTGSGAGDSLRPRQAVILAGGRGTRLGPLTKTRPKPMVEFHGKPFLEYLIEMLREQGFHRILLLLGYLHAVIQEHFGDGERWCLQIDYSVSGADDLTVSRVQLARDRIDPIFLLMYCDNYWPMQIDRMWGRYRALGAPAMVTVYSNADGYRPGKDSVRVNGEGFVEVFDRSRQTPGLRGVEISYAVLDKSVLALLPRHDELFEQALYPRLAGRRELSGYVTDHRYYSVGSLERLPVTERFLARRPAVILDRDGVLNRKPPRARYVTKPADFEWLPGALKALALLSKAGYTVIVVSNQAGVARGAMTEADLDAVNDRMRSEASAGGGEIHAVYCCTHDWDTGCGCRKPAPGLLFQAQRDFDLDLTRTPFIGDDVRDRQAADAAGCPSVLLDDRMTLLDAVEALVAERVEAPVG
jgi:histidinol-phosphate phosphatase family protein